jgi:hypothetical protein
LPRSLPACDPCRRRRRADVITGDPHNNITESIFQKIGVNLHL